MGKRWSAHVADGNFHNFILRDEPNGPAPVWADDMRIEIYETALKYGGTITAEHGTGRTRKPYLALQYSEGTIEIMEVINKYDVIVVEDNPYGEIRFKGEFVPSLKSMMLQRVKQDRLSAVSRECLQ